MKRTFSTLALALLVCAAVPAAVINTTLTVNATGTPSATFTSFAVAGTVSFTGGIGTGKIASTVPLDLTASSVVADYTITLDAGGSLTGKLAVPLSILGGGPATVTVTITGGTGTYSGATSGTSPIALTGTVSGDIVSGFKLTNFTSGTFTITTGGTPPPPVPTITAVQDAASNTPSIAQGSIFIVKGSNLSASGYTPFGPPRPTVSSGVKVTFTPVSGGGAGTDAYLVYLYNQSGVNQIACILPSTVAVGSYNVTVTNGTVSTPVVAQVVANKIGLFTQDSTGSGLASVQNYISQAVVDLNRLTTGSVNGVTISPAHPGQAVIAYGTGLGPLAAADNNPAVAYFDFSKSMTIQAIVGGVTIPVAYAGRAGYPGEDQINFTLPANISPGCAVTLQISVNGKLSAPTSIAIAPDANSTACVMPGFTTQQLTNFDNGGTYTTGYFSLTQFAMSIPSLGTEKVNSIAGAFSKITGFQLASAAQGNVSVIQSGSCQVIQSTSGGTTSASGTLITLDAGTVTINGPAGSSLTNQVLTKTDNSYSLTNIEGFSFPGQTNFSLPAGTYTLNGAGGNDVGTFNTSITLGSPLTLSSPLPDTVVRSAGLTVNWSGGNASDLVEIIGGTSTTTGTGSSAVTNSTSFICITNAGQRTFTVPASILTQLQPATTGSLIVASGVTPATFTASLKAGGSIDYGAFTSFVGIGGSPAYQ